MSLKGYRCRLAHKRCKMWRKPSRPATLKDRGTPDQIVLDQDSLTRFTSQPWCKLCFESWGRDSPHREHSKIDAVVPQLQCDCGHMWDGGPLQIACFLGRNDASSGAMHATMVPDSKKMDIAFSCCWTMWQQHVVQKDNSGKFCDSVTDAAPSEQWGRGESRLHSARSCSQISGSLQRPNPVFRCDDKITDAAVDTQTPSSVGSHTTQREKRHTNDTVREDSWTEIQERDPATG